MLNNLDTFKQQGSQFQSFLAKHQFMHSFIDGDQDDTLAKPEEIAELNAENKEKQGKFIETAHNLSLKLRQLEAVKKKHMEVTNRINEVTKSSSVNDENAAPLDGMVGRSSRSQIIEEIIETEKMVNTLKKQQHMAKEAEEKRILRNRDLQDQLVKSMTAIETAKHVVSTASNENETIIHVKKQISEIGDEQDKQRILLETLEKFTDLHVISIKRNNEDNIVLQIDANMLCSATISLNSSMCVVDLIITKSSVDIDPAKLLCDACILPTPHDLRHILFVLRSSQYARDALEQDLQLLRKRMLVQKLAPLLVQVTFSSGVCARLAVHECYPEVPNSIKCTNLDGIGGWNPNELEEIKRDCNSKCFRNIASIITFLGEILA
jgi:hypothetical protein